MSRVEEIERALSEAWKTKKHIIYLVTDERDILKELFDGAGGEAVELVDGFEKYGTGGTLKFPNKIDSAITDADVDGMVSNTYIYISDFHLFASPELFIKQFLNKAEKALKNPKPQHLALFLISPRIVALEGFEQDVAVIHVPTLGKNDISYMLHRNAKVLAAKEENFDFNAFRAEIDATVSEISDKLVGLSKSQIEAAIAVLEDKHTIWLYCRSHLNESDRKNVGNHVSEYLMKLRKDSTQMDNTITFKEINKDAARKNVAGMDRYIKWLEQEKRCVLNPDEAKKWGITPSRGVLFCGLPGTGKTEAAKHTASKLKIPLVELRMDNLLGKFVGESESRFKQYRNKVESLAPCVVLIDEIEKTFGESDDGGGSGSHDIKMHLLQALLDWLQDGKKGVFFYATCNSLRGINKWPELLREGRFSQKFTIFMPTHDALAKIIAMHMNNAKDMIKENGGTAPFEGESFSEKAANLFLDKISDEIKKKKKDYFYTGANIAQLVNLTQTAYRDTTRYAFPDDYAEKMYGCAISGDSLPYGNTNMREIIEFWMLARKNRYPDAAGDTLFPFEAFEPGDDTKKEPSRFNMTPAMKSAVEAHPYNKLMFDRISKEIIKYYDLSISNMQNYRRIDVE
jgi:ATP-dependent 26S proteasome regulatory subunit